MQRLNCRVVTGVEPHILWLYSPLQTVVPVLPQGVNSNPSKGVPYTVFVERLQTFCCCVKNNSIAVLPL